MHSVYQCPVKPAVKLDKESHMHKIEQNTNTGVMNKTAYFSSSFEFGTTFCLKTKRSLVKIMNPWKHCIKLCNHYVSLTNKPPDWRGLQMVHGCKSLLIGAFHGSLVTN